MDNERVLKILMLEDSEDDVLLIERVLRKNNLSFVSERVDTEEEFTNAIQVFKPDIVLSDHGLPGFNSRQALRICKAEKVAAPFILVTGTVSDEYAISCLKDGASDYIFKSDLKRLPTAILRAVKENKLEKLKRGARHALRKQNQELIKVNKELDNFVYHVSHSLRGPLTSLMGLINVAHATDKEKQLVQLLTMMSESVSKLDGTLHEIIDYSRNARHEIQLGEVDWDGVIRSCIGKLQYLRDPNSIVHFLSLEANTAFYSDGSRIGVILNNLLSNSILFADKERELLIGIEVTVTDAEAMIIVKDNGIGIGEDVLPKIFDMFYRGSEQSQGAGLGLYIVKEMVCKLDGAINIKSTLDLGTTVTVTLPNVRLCDL